MSDSRGRKMASFPELSVPVDEQAQSATPQCLYRLKQVLARIPISKSSWFAGIKAGRYPRGLHLGPRTTVWRSEDIDRIIANLGNAA